MTPCLLIVDDSRLARMSVRRLLDQLRPGWRVLEADSAAAAVALLAAHKPDAALLDYNMPGQDGLALAAELRAAAPDLPIGIVSANYQDYVVSTAGALGAIFLAKPLNREAFADFLAGLEDRLG